MGYEKYCCFCDINTFGIVEPHDSTCLTFAGKQGKNCSVKFKTYLASTSSFGGPERERKRKQILSLFRIV